MKKFNEYLYAFSMICGVLIWGSIIAVLVWMYWPLFLGLFLLSTIYWIVKEFHE